ncbi:MAG: protein HflC [Gemmatimonadota bacterium]|nr:MAG: protein HflC [Gemmatimonadota bacterium]
MSRSLLPMALLAIVILFVVGGTLYTIPEGEQVIITQFGKPVGDPITDSGLHFKIPLIQRVNRFEKRWLAWDGDANQMPTRDKRFIWVDTFARWRISDPLLFFQRVRDERGAQTRLDDILDGETRKAIANWALIEVVRSENRKFEISSDADVAGATAAEAVEAIAKGREAIVNDILELSREKTKEFGIELVDVRFKRLNYVEGVRRSVYERMIAERQKIRDKLRSEGQGRSAEIRGSKDRELKRITSEAYKTAQEIQGAADSTATKIYADAFGRDAEFYSFLQTLETYRNTIGSDETLVMSTDGEFYRFLKGTAR